MKNVEEKNEREYIHENVEIRVLLEERVRQFTEHVHKRKEAFGV